jgi:hypothetical protein
VHFGSCSLLLYRLSLSNTLSATKLTEMKAIYANFNLDYMYIRDQEDKNIHHQGK